MTDHRMIRASPSLVDVANLREAGEGVFYTDQSFVVVDKAVIAFLKDKVRMVAKKRARLCAHPGPESDQHDMLIVSHRDTYVAPHRHSNKSESFLILEGFAEAILFDQSGAITERIPMGPADSGRPFLYRMPAGQFHSLAIETELLVFLESTKGPFIGTAIENAPWAPHPNESARGQAYIRDISSIRD